MKRLIQICVLMSVMALTGRPADAQGQTPEPWEGSVAAGLALTGGNAQTTTTNLAFTVQSDKTKRNVIRAEGLNIRSSRDGDAIIDRTLVQAQDDYGLGPKTYVFGRFLYLRDVFKAIDYLISPTAGLGYKVVDTTVSTLTADVAVGAVSEKNPGIERHVPGGHCHRHHAQNAAQDRLSRHVQEQTPERAHQEERYGARDVVCAQVLVRNAAAWRASDRRRVPVAG
jgi:Protein of unknown function, DUF481